MTGTPLSSVWGKAASLCHRHPFFAVAAASACGFLAVAFLVPSIFSGAALVGPVGTQIRAMTGLSLVSRGPSRLHVLPHPSIEMDDVAIADAAGALHIRAKSLQAELRLLPLVIGRFEMSSLRLEEPDIDIDIDRRPDLADSPIGRAAQQDAKLPTDEADSESRLGVVELIGGRARLASRSFASALRFDHIRMTLDWRQFEAPAKLSGTTRIEDEPAELAVWIAKPADLLRGNPSSLMLRLASATCTLWTNGSVASTPRLHYTGRIAASAASLRRVIGIFGYSLPVPAPLQDMHVAGIATIAANTAAFSNLRLRVDGNDFEGTLAMQRGDQKPNLSGTLATNRLDLTPLLAESGPLLDAERQWSARPFDLTGIGATDVDLRISAAQVQMAGLALQDAAFSLMSKNGGVELAVPEAKTLGGLLKARFTMAADGNALDFHGNASASNIDLGAFAKAQSQASALTGSVAGTATFQASGTSFSALFHHLNGQANVTLRNGVIAGVDLMQILQEQMHPHAIKADFGAGHTPFDDARFALHIVDGRGSVENGRANTAGATIAFGGSADFGERSLDIKARADGPGGGVLEGGAPNPHDDGALFDLVGSWDAVRVIPAL